MSTRTGADADADPIRWGILATGSIAAKFAADLAMLADHELAAVGSRSSQQAHDFARQYGPAVRGHGSYQDLIDDPEIDVVYVATPHGRHYRDVLACFDAGKAVLCEKPLTVDPDETRHLIAEARRRQLFFAEAMWMRLNPVIRHLRALVDDGACGRVAQVRAELGFSAPEDKARLWESELGASALLDVGIYPLTLAHLLLGQPAQVNALGVLFEPPDGSKSFDVSGGATLTYDTGAVASLAWTQVAVSDNRASIAGDLGRIEFGRRMHEPRELTLTTAPAGVDAGTDTDSLASQSHTWHHRVIGRGYAQEAIEVGECLRAGRTESDKLPLDESLEILHLMHQIREQIRGGAMWVQ